MLEATDTQARAVVHPAVRRQEARAPELHRAPAEPDSVQEAAAREDQAAEALEEARLRRRGDASRGGGSCRRSTERKFELRSVTVRVLREPPVSWLTLRPAMAAPRSRRRADARGLPAAGRARRCVAGRAAAGGRPLRVPVRRPGLLAVLQFAPHRHHGHVGHLAARSARRSANWPAATPRGSPRSRAARPCWWPRSGVCARGSSTAASIVNFVSETVLVGFKCGVAFVLASTQIAEALRLQGRRRRLLAAHGAHRRAHRRDERGLAAARRWPRSRCCVAGKILLPERPVALVVVIAGIARDVGRSTLARAA